MKVVAEWNNVKVINNKKKLLYYLILLFFTLTGLVCFALRYIYPPPEITYQENKAIFHVAMYFLSIPVYSRNDGDKEIESVDVLRLFDFFKDEKNFDEKTFVFPLESEEKQFYIPLERLEEAKAAVRGRLRSRSDDPGELKLISHDDTIQVWEISYWTSVSHIAFRYEATRNTVTPIFYREDNVVRVLKFFGISIVFSLVTTLFTYTVIIHNRD